MSDPRYKALLIGNGIFERDPHNLSLLKGPANDLKFLREALSHPEHGLFEATNVKPLLDGTHSEVLEAIDTFFGDAGPEDHLLFFYSGHGYPDTNNNLYLCARNTRTNLLVSTGVPDSTINLMAENSRARKFIFILDCCHSGAFKGGELAPQLGQGSGRCLITSCASDQLSADAKETAGASVFTYHLSQALTNTEVDVDGDGIVLVSEVFRFVQPRVYAATKQTVQWTMDKTFGEAAIARCAPRKPAEWRPLPPPPEASPRGRPMLELSETRIEFREVAPGEVLPAERIDVFNSGEGDLDWLVECDEKWVAIEQSTDHFKVTLDTAEPGVRRGNILVRDRGRGGSRTVRVLLQITQPEQPALAVSPAKLDFGAQPENNAPKLEVRVSNAGRGRLQWDVIPTSPHLLINRIEGGFTVEVEPRFVGELKGSVRVKSNGGEAELPVTGKITFAYTTGKEPYQTGGVPPLIPQNAPIQQLLGWWSNNTGAVNIKINGGVYVYAEYNIAGIQIGEGTMQVRGNTIFVQGANSFSGPYIGQMSIQGNILAGSITAMGQMIPAMFTRIPPWFAMAVP